MKPVSKLAASELFPGGVNSPVRAFQAVGGNPLIIKRGKGPYVWDRDGNRYLDFVMSWGPLILGHANPKVVKAVRKQAALGTTYGAPTENETRLARLIRSAFPAVEKMRLVSSGTEAVMSAVRLARGASGKKKMVKCDGCYHGHVDSLLIRGGSGLTTFGVPDSAGVPDELAALTVSVPYNDPEALECVFEKEADQIACFIVEPVPANMGVVLPKSGYLKAVRRLCTKYGVLLIFDEVVSGFRIAYGGAQEYFGVRADLTCLGKIAGGGLPLAAYGGRRDLMDHVAPTGRVYQAGTLSGNPIATAAGIAALSEIGAKDFYVKLNRKAGLFYKRLEVGIKKASLPVQLNRLGSCFTIFFTLLRVDDYGSAKRCHTDLYARFFRQSLDAGIYFAPSQFEANFISISHSDHDLAWAAEKILTILRHVGS